MHQNRYRRQRINEDSFKGLALPSPSYAKLADTRESPRVTLFFFVPQMPMCHHICLETQHVHMSPYLNLAPKGPSVTLFFRGPLNVHMSPYLPTPCYWWLRPKACQAIVAAQSLPTRALWHAFWHAFVARGIPSSSPAGPEWLSPTTAAFFRVIQKCPFGGPGCFSRPRVLQNGGTLCLRCALKRRLQLPSTF